MAYVVKALNFLVLCFRKLHLSCFQRMFSTTAHTIVRAYLKRRLKDIDLYEASYSETDSIPKIIWVLWWQGIEKAPDIVRVCVQSIQNKTREQNIDVRLLDQNNVGSYIDIDPIIQQRMENGEICKAVFADYIRCKLLSKYGGIWLDSTILLTRQLRESIFELEFWTVKTNWRIKELHNLGGVSAGRWITSAMGACPQNPLMLFLAKSLGEILAGKDKPIDYFLIDHLIALAYDENKVIRAMIDAVPESNIYVYFLSEYGNENVDEITLKNIIDETDIFKLTYKKVFHLDSEQEALTRVLHSLKSL